MLNAFRISGFVIACLFTVSTYAAEPKDPGDRGEYVFNMGGCASCHTDGKNKGAPLAGGLALKTPFGTFYSPNITPDPETGIGGWTDEEFIRAMTDGISPEGKHYFPAFPYTSYAKMTRRDLLDLKAYLDSIPPVQKSSPEHDLAFPFNMRVLAGAWKALFFEDDGFQKNPDKSDAWNRGAYIVNGPGHCVECHTPRNLFGAIVKDKALEGVATGAEGEKVPGIVANGNNGFSKWKMNDIVFGLQTGMTPDGDFLGGTMGKVIANTTGKLSDADLQAIATYLNDPE